MVNTRDLIKQARKATAGMEGVPPIIYDATVAALGFDPSSSTPQLHNPTPEEIKRGRRITKRVMGKLNHGELLATDASTTEEVAADESIVETQEIVQVGPISAPPAYTEEQIQERRRNGLV